MSALEGVTALTFDVFGTVVDWHGTVSREMEERTLRSTSHESKGMSAKGKDGSKSSSLYDTDFSCPTEIVRTSRRNGEEVIW